MNQNVQVSWYKELDKLNKQTARLSSSSSIIMSLELWHNGNNKVAVQEVNKKKTWMIPGHMWVFPKIGFLPQIIHFNKVFHYKL